MANNATSPLDHTGHAKEQVQKKTAKERADRADELSMLEAVEKERLEKGVFDPMTQTETVVLDEIESVGVSLANDTVVIRTQTDIENMTFGVGNEYTFKAGVKYTVPRALAEYLERLGYVWRPS